MRYTDSNVAFSLVYDAAPARVQRWFRIVQNVILTGFLLAAFVPFSKRTLKMSTSTGVLLRPTYVPPLVMFLPQHFLGV